MSSPSRIERPGIGGAQVILGVESPNLGRGGLPARAAGALTQARTDADGLKRIAAGLHEGAHGRGIACVAEQETVGARGQDLSHLPGVGLDLRRGCAVGRERADDRGRGVTATRRTGIVQAAHEGGQPDDIQRKVLEFDGEVVRPGIRLLPAGLVAQRGHAVHVDGLAGFEQLDATVDASHAFSSMPSGYRRHPTSRRR